MILIWRIGRSIGIQWRRRSRKRTSYGDSYSMTTEHDFVDLATSTIDNQPISMG